MNDTVQEFVDSITNISGEKTIARFGKSMSERLALVALGKALLEDGHVVLLVNRLIPDRKWKIAAIQILLELPSDIRQFRHSYEILLPTVSHATITVKKHVANRLIAIMNSDLSWDLLGGFRGFTLRAIVILCNEGISHSTKKLLVAALADSSPNELQATAVRVCCLIFNIHGKGLLYDLTASDQELKSLVQLCIALIHDHE